MALILKDRVKESSASSGTGSITLGGAFPGYQTFNAAIATGSTVYYTIHNLTAGFDTEWEVGVGTFTSPNTLARNTVLSSSNSGSLVPFTAGASGLEVFITQPAEQALYTNQATGKVEVFGNGTNIVTFTEINTTNLTANTVTVTAGTISTNAANATDITNKTYVDGLFSQSISYHEAVLVESPSTAGSLNVVYVQPNGAGNGVGATLTNNGANVALVVDGVTVSNTARVLIYSQSNAVQNGVYTVTNPGAPDPGGAKWVLTRATDADTFGLANPNTLGAGDAFFVQSGNTGAGETYVCNTQGTITFGSSNITFAQISSAQIYAAGTGLNLSNLTFSIANTAVTAAQYGNDGAVGQFTVNAQGQITNAANVSINASSISVGTLANARTTADSANGASTIVLRDANGSFNANVVTATTVNATTGNFTNITANASGLTDINASNISSGTISNARTTGSASNSASTIVLRDANGAFEAGNVTAANFIGAGTTITSINASNISSGTIDNARTTAASSNGASTIVSRDSGGNFSANTVTAAVIGDISGGSNINASNISSGTIANARTTASASNGASTIVLRDAGGAFAAGAITGTSFTGNGSAITAINASAITTGTIDNARTTAASANGANTIVLRDASGDFSVDGITANWFTGNGANLSAINASNISSGTIDNARTTAASANGASTIVARDTNGSFSANVVTATTVNATSGNFTNVSGNGASLTAINASSLSSGTVNTARISGSYTGITEVGTLTAGTWNASTIGAQYGGTGSANLTANNVILGNGASSVQFVAPGTNGNVLTSNGSTWVSTAPSGGVTSITGTANQVIASASTGAVTLSTPQSINTTSSVQFGSFGVGTAASGTTGEIRATNNVTAYYSSDERLKDNVQVIANALAKVLQIRGVEFDWNNLDEPEDGYFVRKHDVGVIAQEVEKVLPEVVGTRENGMKAVKYDRIIPLLIEAIKELKAEVDALKGR
jgi:trimeric autotransporter adhesin